MRSHACMVGLLAAVCGLSDPSQGAIILVPNEKGSSINTLDTSNGQVGTFLNTGVINNPDGLFNAPDGFVYATSFVNGTLSRILSSSSATTIASGFTGSGALTRDSSGAFYVPNFSSSPPSGPSGPAGGTTIAKVTPVGASYSTNQTFATGLSTPDGLAFDNSGVLYEADFGANRINIINTTTGAVTNYVQGVGLNQPSALVVDASNILYVANFGNGTVTRIVPGVTPTVTNNFATGLGSPLGMMLDAASGKFYVSDWNGNTVSSFPIGGGTRTLIASGFNGPTHLIFAPVPEPSTLWLVGLGLTSLGLAYRRQLSPYTGTSRPSG